MPMDLNDDAIGTIRSRISDFAVSLMAAPQGARFEFRYPTETVTLRRHGAGELRLPGSEVSRRAGIRRTTRSHVVDDSAHQDADDHPLPNPIVCFAHFVNAIPKTLEQ